MAYYLRLSERPDEIKMYYTLHREYYWPQMANNAFTVIKSCISWARMRCTQRRHQNLMKLFSGSERLEFVPLNSLGASRMTAPRFIFVLSITDRFTRLASCLPLRNMTAVVVANAILHYGVYAYGASLYAITDNGKKFTAKFFDAVCSILSIRHFLMTAHHPQTNG